MNTLLGRLTLTTHIITTLAVVVAGLTTGDHAITTIDFFGTTAVELNLTNDTNVPHTQQVVVLDSRDVFIMLSHFHDQ